MRIIPSKQGTQIFFCNGMIHSRIFFHQLVKNDITTRDIIRKIATGQGDDFFAYLTIHHSKKNTSDSNRSKQATNTRC